MASNVAAAARGAADAADAEATAFTSSTVCFKVHLDGRAGQPSNQSHPNRGEKERRNPPNHSLQCAGQGILHTKKRKRPGLPAVVAAEADAADSSVTVLSGLCRACNLRFPASILPSTID